MQSFEQPATRRNHWSSAPPAMTVAPPKRSLFSIAVIGAVWVAVGAASAAYVATRAHDVQPSVAATEVADR